MFTRRSFLGTLAALLSFGKAQAAPPEVLPLAPAAPPEPKADSKDPGWGPTHVHDWIEHPAPAVEVTCEVQVCSHPECYAYKVYHHDRSTGSADAETHEYAPNFEMGLPVIYNHKDWWEMSRHVVAYIDKTEATLLSADNPMRRTIGFSAFGEGLHDVQFDIPLTKLKNIALASRGQGALISTYLVSQEGRMKLAAAMLGAGLNHRKTRLGLTC